MNTAPDNSSAPFSVGEARKTVGDLFKHNPLIYWIDFIVCWAVGMFIYTHGRTYAAKLYLATDFDKWKVDWMYYPIETSTTWILYITFTIVAALL